MANGMLAMVSPETRAVHRPTAGMYNVSLDFNAAPGGRQVRGVEVIIPDDAGDDVRRAAEDYNRRVVEFASRHGITDYRDRGVKTRSQNKRGVPHTIHTEPFFNTDLEMQRAIQGDMEGFSSIYRDTFGQLENARIIPPHGVGADRGAASQVFENETAFGKAVVDDLMAGATPTEAVQAASMEQQQPAQAAPGDDPAALRTMASVDPTARTASAPQLDPPAAVQAAQELLRRPDLTEQQRGAAQEFLRRQGVDAATAEAGSARPTMEQIIQRGRELGREQGRTGAAILNAGEGVFGLGARAGAGLDMMRNDFTYEENLAFRRAQAEGAAEANPVAGTAGYAAGVLTGGAGGAGLAARAAPRVAAAAAPVAGQRVRNIGRLAGIGAAGGAAQAAGEGSAVPRPGEVTAGAATGAVVAPAAVGAIRGAGRILERAARPTRAGLRRIASALRRPEESGSDAIERVTQAIDDFRGVHGRNPAINEIMDPVSPNPVRQAVEDSPIATRTAMEASDNTLRDLPEELARRGGVLGDARSPSPERMQMLAEQEFGTFMQRNGSQVISTTDELADMVRQPLFTRAALKGARDDTSKALRRIAEGEDVNIRTLNAARKRINRQMRTIPHTDGIEYESLRNMRETINDTIAAENPAYREVLKSWGRRMDAQQGIKLGRRVATKADPASFRDAYELANPATRQGMRWGARSRIRTMVGESPQGAIRDLRRISEDTGLQRRLNAMLPDEEVSQIVNNARIAHNALISRIASTPMDVRTQNQVALMARDAIETGVFSATSPTAATRSLVDLVSRMGRQLGMSEGTRREIARLAYDPANTPEVYKALLDAGATPAQWRQMLNPAMTAAPGQVAAGEVVE